MSQIVIDGDISGDRLLTRLPQLKELRGQDTTQELDLRLRPETF